MNKNIFLLTFFISILLTSGIAKAADWHKPIPCLGCHGETLDVDVGGGECGSCHNYVSLGQINVQQMEREHNPKICNICHIGSTLVNGTEKELFHNGHSAVNCTECHTEDNFTVIKIKSNGFECVSCHGNEVHRIHIERIDKACPLCHGSWASGKVYRVEDSSSSNLLKEKDKLEKFTIFNFIKNLFNALLGM